MPRVAAGDPLRRSRQRSSRRCRTGAGASEAGVRTRHRARSRGQPRRGALAPLGSLGARAARRRRAEPAGRGARTDWRARRCRRRLPPRARRAPGVPEGLEQPDSRAGQSRQGARSRGACARARRRIADDPDRYFTLGLAQSEQDVDGAIETFRTVLELAPRHTLARYNLALVLRRADRLPEALDELERALAIEPRAGGPLHDGHHLLAPGRSRPGGAAPFARPSAAEPEYADAHYALGSVLKAKRDWTRRGRVLAPGDRAPARPPGPHYTLGQVLQIEWRRTGRAGRARRSRTPAPPGAARARSASLDVGWHPEHGLRAI